MPLNPPPAIDGDLGLITFPLTFGSLLRPALVTFAVDVGASSLPDAQDAVDDFQANFTTQFAASLDSLVGYGPATIKLGNGTTVPYEAAAAAGVQFGTATGSWGSASLAALVKKSTGLGGKANRGRTYWPYLIPTSHIVEPGFIDSTELAAYQTHFTAFFNQLTTDGTPMVIANKVFAHPAPPLKPYVTAIHKGATVTSYILEAQLATQRRRLRP